MNRVGKNPTGFNFNASARRGLPNNQRDDSDAIGETSALASLPSGYLARGLSAAEVAQRAARGEINRIARSEWKDYFDIFIRNLVTLFNVLVVPAAVALFALGDYRAAWAVSAYAVINALIGLVQEIRAKHHLDQLAIHTAVKVRVLRDGESRTIAADEIVRGDYLLLAAGDAVAADGEVLAAQSLEIDEALLTGESDPVARVAGDRLLSGSICVAGQGGYRADRVGVESFAQQTSIQARRYHYSPSPMQKIVDTIIRALTATAVLLCLLYFGLYFLRGFPQSQLWQMIAATVTSMVPQGLVLMTTLTFTLGAVRMSKRGAIVQRLNAIESMASVDLLCLDKTGTLTTNELRLDQLRIADTDENSVRERLQLFAWGSIDAGNKSIGAIRSALGPLPPGNQFRVIEQTPFKSQNRFSAVRFQLGEGECFLVLGAYEALKPFLTGPRAAEIDSAWHELSPTGLRLLAFAQAQSPVDLPPLSNSLQGVALQPLALVALSDELRPDAGPVLQALAAQGIQFKILSGDHVDTIRATINQLQLPLAREAVVTEQQFDGAIDRARVIREGSIFGRVTPRRKLEIVATLQAAGHQVAMIGDGINDILSIKRANLGIAMGSGASATKTVAGLVLENNNFGLLPAALDEGRTILHNLRRVSKVFLLKNVYSFFLIVFGLGVLGLDFPYLPQQVTLLNSLTIGVPAFLIMLSKPSASRPTRKHFLREVGLFVFLSGVIVGTAGLAVWLIFAKWVGADPQTQRTALLSALILLGLGNLLIISERDIRLCGWSLVAVLAYLAVLQIPPLAHFFALTPLPATQWALVVLISAVAIIPCAMIGRFLTGGDAADSN